MSCTTIVLTTTMLLSAGIFASVCQASDDRVLDIGSRLELMIDDYLIERISGEARLQLHEPIRRDIAIAHDEPWEGNSSGYHTVFRDGDVYRMYYRGGLQVLKGEPPAHKNFGCYAESKDGIHWTKPKLGLFEFQGSKANNIVWQGVGTHNFTPFKDANPDCPAEAKYKAAANLSDEAGILYATPWLAKKLKSVTKADVPYVAALSVTRGQTIPVVVGADSRFRIVGQVESPTNVTFGITTLASNGGFAGKYSAVRTIKVSEPDGRFDIEIPLLEFQPVAVKKGLAESPSGQELADWWCITKGKDVKLAIVHVELLPAIFP